MADVEAAAAATVASVMLPTPSKRTSPRKKVADSQEQDQQGQEQQQPASIQDAPTEEPAAEAGDTQAPLISDEDAAAALKSSSFNPLDTRHAALVRTALHYEGSTTHVAPSTTSQGLLPSSAIPGAPAAREQQFTQLHGVLSEACKTSTGR
jgi:hypothetical protein